MNKIETYKMKGQCANCGNRQSFDIPKGVSTSAHKVPCDYCGCKDWYGLEKGLR